VVPGAFVRALFPTREKPREPGLLHVCYTVGITSSRVVVAYTTSQPWPAGVPLPIGARPFSLEEAARLNQSRAFLLRLDIMAQLPPSPVWFPDIAKTGQGVIAVAPARLRQELEDTLARLVSRRGSLIQMRGA